MLAGGLTGQISFSESESGVTKDFRNASAIVSIDMNDDTQDDLVRLNNGINLQVDLQHSGGDFITTHSNIVSENAEWFLIAGDVNNDGWPDIVTGGIIDKIKVLTAVPFTNDFQVSEIDDELFFAQGANIVDANDDGFMDIFVCNDNGINRLYLNDGAEEFVRNDTLIDFRTVPVSDNSGNYGSVWTDFDMDGDLDLYITKCRQGVFDDTDPRRINALFVNTDSGYVEMADTFGLAIGAQSWSSDFADIDNDGDLDIIVINHDVPSQLFENVGNGEYEDITTQAGIDIIGKTIQSIFRDFDNDGLVDLLIGGSASKLYHNMGENIFEEVSSPFGPESVKSFTIGDFNDDGFPDVYATYHTLYNTPSDSKDDRLWLNNGTDNNYVRIKAIGSNGNTSATGAKLFLHGAWGTQMREIRTGESYGIGTSLIQNFGLGDDTAIDSLVIIWPNGDREIHKNIPINVTVTVSEGGCLRQVESLDQGPFVQCGSDTFTITAPDGFDAYLWSNGMVSQSIEVFETGLYNVSLIDFGGCVTATRSVTVMDNTQSGDGEIINAGGDAFCYGKSVTLTAPEGVAYTWNTGETTNAIEATESGSYAVTVTRSCYEAFPEPIVITVYNANILDVANDTILGAGQGLLTADGDSVNWFEALDELIPIASGNAFTTPVVDTTTTYFAQQSLLSPGNSFGVGMTEHMGGSKYNAENINLGLIFDALADFRLDSVMTYTDFSGKRSVVLLDSSGSVLLNTTVQIDSGVQWVPLAFDIPAGVDYMLTTDGDTNAAVFGVASPQLVRSKSNVEYPYTVDDVVSITGTDAGEQYYYYFYNWQITSAPKYCIGERKPVLVVVEDTSTSVIILSEGTLKAYPNPTSDVVTIEVDNSFDFDYEIRYAVRSIDGRKVRSGIWQPGTQISMRGLPSGMYHVELLGEGVVGIVRIVVVGRE